MKKYREIFDRWLNGESQRFSNGLADFRKEGWVTIHYGQLVGKTVVGVEDVNEAVSIFAELIERVEEMGEDWVVKMHMPLESRRRVIKEMKELVKALPVMSGAAYYLVKPENLASPYPEEIHRWTFKPGSYGKYCPKAKWFLEQSRKMEEIEEGEEYNTEIVGWWRRDVKR